MGNREAVRKEARMTTYSVNWKIEIEAESRVEAARQALEIHRDPNSTATVFDVYDQDGNCTRVDLLEVEESRICHIAGGQPDLIGDKAATANISYWEDDVDFPSDDWKYEVTLGNTRLGYHDWVQHERAAKKNEPGKTPE
jgi:hypothetical protein